MWNKIRSLQGRKFHKNIYLTTNSSLNTDSTSIAHLLGLHFEKNSSNEMYSHDFLRENANKPPPQPSSISPQNSHQSYLNNPITIEEILKALKKCIKQSYYFTPEQCGFRKNKGTYNCLSKIHTEIQNTYSENQYLGMISLDLMKAYDTTWKPHILTSLSKVLSQNQMFNFIINFLKTRTFQVRINQSLSKVFEQANGIPQGSTISVTLFLIAINNITQNISYPIKSTLYADDFNIYCRSQNLATVQCRLQKAINNLQKWTQISGFTFSPEKSKCIVFTRKRFQNPIKIKLGVHLLINYNTIKILGITFDKRCSWTHHIDFLKTSTSPRLNIIKMLSHTSWGSKSYVLLTIYKSLILSKLNYRSFIWTTASKSITKKLDTIHNAGLSISIGAYRSSPIPSIYNLACTPPLDIRRLKITLNHELKLASTLPSLDFNPKFKTLSILLQENNLVISDLLTISPPLAPQWIYLNETNTELSILKKKDTSSSIYKQEYFHLIQNIKCEKMYTDASKNQIGVGAAVVWNNIKFMYKLPKSCSVFTSESFAIIKALELITDHQLQDTIIFTDSLSAINNIKNTNNPSDIVVNEENILLSDQDRHTHIPCNDLDINRQMLSTTCKRKASEELFIQPKKIILKELAQNSQLADGLTSNDFNTIRKVIYISRRKVLPVLPSNIIEAHMALNTSETVT
ncbi:uncharacterized protein LOC132947738 [Metopolophium dirhodum]|uniref:uncharacterized protein LOC132947738 n=1 Tax=Metopolophium dirhodum TaxID=44670 RepID=UPI0029905135|nr:uncharacterized protein LOC132947738 [Metopolophium dirhodum]